MGFCVVLMFCLCGVEIFKSPDIDAMPWSCVRIHVTHDADAIKYVGIEDAKTIAMAFVIALAKGGVGVNDP